LAEQLFGENARHIVVRKQMKLPDVHPNDPEAWHGVHPSWAVRRQIRLQQRVVWNAALSHVIFSSSSSSDSDFDSDSDSDSNSDTKQ
jgi:hypothetical protein